MAPENDQGTENQATAAAAEASAQAKPFQAGAIDQPTPAQLAADREKKRADLQAQIDALTPKPKTLAEKSDDELFVDFYDELVSLLGSHPRLESIWNEMRQRHASLADAEHVRRPH